MNATDIIGHHWPTADSKRLPFAMFYRTWSSERGSEVRVEELTLLLAPHSAQRCPLTKDHPSTYKISGLCIE
jgi:hypothetical protein